MKDVNQKTNLERKKCEKEKTQEICNYFFLFSMI